MDYKARSQMVKDEVALFPGEFKLYRQGDSLFRVSEYNSFFSPKFEGNDYAPASEAHVKLYLQILSDSGSWLDYCKTTKEELRSMIRRAG